MNNITYDQFVRWCEHWDLTVDEGHKAMCFTSNIVNQYFGNCIDYVNIVSHDDNHSDAFKRIIEKQLSDSKLLLNFYNRLFNQVFIMLEEHDEENK